MVILRLFLFLLRLGVLLAIFLALASLEGRVSIGLLGYRIETRTGLLFGALAVLLLIFSFLLGGVRRIGRTGRAWRQRRERARWRESRNLLLHGLLAHATGDHATQHGWLKKAQNLLSGDPLLLLLEAQMAQELGEYGTAAAKFHALARNPGTQVAGRIGEMRALLAKGAEDEAWQIARDLATAPSLSGETASEIFTLALSRGAWDEADHLASRGPAERRALWHSRLHAERARRALAENDGETASRQAKLALKARPDFLPAQLLAVQAALELGDARKALTLIARFWQEPSAAFLPLFFAATADMPPLERVRAGERLVMADHPAAHRLGAQLACQAGLWGEARRHLEALDPPDREACQLWSTWFAQDGDKDQEIAWLRRAQDAPPAPSWHCSLCLGETAGWAWECPLCHGHDSIRFAPGHHRQVPRLAPPLENPGAAP